MIPILTMSDGDVCYGNTLVAYVKLLQVFSGEVVLLNGPNGSGKTSIFLSIINSGARFTGKLLYFNRDLSSLATSDRLSAGIVFIPQGRRTFPRLSVNQHVRLSAYWLRSHASEVPLSSTLSHGRGSELSGGEAKTVLIESLSFRDHQILIMDEPLASLDHRRCAQVIELIRDRAGRGIGCLISDHTGLIAERLNPRNIELVLKERGARGWFFSLEGGNDD